MKTRRHKISLPMCIMRIALTFGILIAGLCLTLKSLRSPPFNDLPFNRNIWQSSQTHDEKERRAQMAGDLTRHHLRKGMTTKEVLTLLGPPEKQTDDPYTWARAPHIPGVHELFQYNMGRPRMDMTGVSYLLQLYFDRGGHYLSSSIEVD